MFHEKKLINHIGELEKRSASGQLFLGKDGEQIRLYFFDGLIDAASSALEEFRLGQSLLMQHLLDSSELDRLLARSRKEGTPIGELAVEYEILDVSQLLLLVEEQIVRLFRRAVERNFQILSFEANPRPFRYRARVTSARLKLEQARKAGDAITLDQGHRVSIKSANNLPALPWTPEEIAVLGLLKTPRTLSETISESGLEGSDVIKILGVFERMNLLQVSNGISSTTMALVKKEGLPLELLVPRIGNPVYDDKMEVINNEHSFISEQFKSLKVRLNEVQHEKPAQLISVSSAFVKDGKSLVASNLALCFARDPGRRVLLLDCDLRNPTVHRNFGIPLAPGLVDYLLTGNLEPYCFIRRVDRLYVLSAGGFADNPIELLTLSRMNELIAFLKEEFDTVIIDSPPLNPIADARIVTALSDASLMVIRRGKTPYRSIENAFRSVDRRKFLGVIFNDVKPVMFNTYYEHGYYRYGGEGGYPYGYGYPHQKSSAKRRKL